MRLMATRVIIGKILSFFELQSPSLQVSCFKVLPNVFNNKGEFVLKELMANFHGFDHNEQSLRIVTVLEKKYPSFDGLNLTMETLEGLIKHNGPYKENKKILSTGVNYVA